MKKISTLAAKKSGLPISLGLIAVSVMYAASQHLGVATHTALAATSAVTSVPTMKTVTSVKKTSSAYADGSYIGSAVDAYYGTVQVKATIQNGQLADVTFLQYPNNRSNSVYINGQAMPMLTQEALAVQSAQVNGVSGATFTSQAFQQSLRSALAQA